MLLDDLRFPLLVYRGNLDREHGGAKLELGGKCGVMVDKRTNSPNSMPLDALDCFTIKGFKSIASLEKLELRPINLVIGANGSGKSNFLDAFSFLREIREGHLQNYVRSTGGSEKLLHFGSKTTKEIAFHLSFGNVGIHYELKLLPTEDDSLFPSEEIAAYRASKTTAGPDSTFLPPQQRRLEAGISNPNLSGIPGYVGRRLEGWRVYHFADTAPMRDMAEVHNNHFLYPDGSNLASILYYLREADQGSYGLIQQTIQRVAPFFDDFRLQPLKLNPKLIQLEWRHKNSDQYFDASSLSDGTLRFIVLATLFLQPKPKPDHPSTSLLVDEPELGLHPYAIGLLASLIKQKSLESQVIVSTQSSLLLDHFQPEDVLVANRVGGGTEITRPDPAQLATWLEEYSLGQLWEKNEIGGRPA
jgi:predicted ATPase